ncbi:beta-galactosidase [Caldibacillus lycopersici]|uniref:Beta-galactosidase n=1 Tax=Perspicuibacillus lycopersici TaxID=1325689 RepID=A0AAE3LPS8_9BACI|nr:beta-galactosidase [Perspicuibacillus lycopersici]MCU9612624.1 beta-galactosidase [Perspicuibacillus lycopersici]
MKIKSNAFYPDAQTEKIIVSENAFQILTSSTGGAVKLDGALLSSNLWMESNYVCADIYHESDNVLVIVFRFTEHSNKQIKVHYGILPFVKTRLCFPLKALDGEKLFLNRYPGVMQSVLRGDSRINRAEIKDFAIETISSLNGRQIEVDNVQFLKEEPDFLCERLPYIDELGQLIHKEWANKTKTVEEMIHYLKNQWAQSQRPIQSNDDFGRFGGWKHLTFTSTGYFRTEYDGENWWFVDPDGYALFSIGIDCVHPDDSMKVTGMEHLITWLPEQTGRFQQAFSRENFCYSIANLIRAFGDLWWEKWADIMIARFKEWGVNTIGNWSSDDFISYSKLPYVIPLASFPTTEKTIYRDFPDVFSTEYDENAKEFATQLLPFKDDRYLIGYFMRNEPHWAFVDGLDLTETMLLHSQSFVSKDAFIDRMKEKYTTIDQLNKSWNTQFSRFSDLLYPEKIELTGFTKQKDDFQEFNKILIRKYVEIPTRYCREVDPNHLNLGMRYAWISNEALLEGCELFDVFSINSYQRKPDENQIEKISQKLKIPVMIGEFHFGAADVGMLAYGIRAVANQSDRGAAYRYYVEQAATIKGLIGVHYFQQNDQPVLGRFDGENYQIGVHDVCLRPYDEFVEGMKTAHNNLYFIRIGKRQATDYSPKEIPKTGF